MQDIRTTLGEGNLLVADGATGTVLQSMGLPAGASPELWNVDRPDAVRALHRAYLDAGSQVILTNTFGGSRLKLERSGGGDIVNISSTSGLKGDAQATIYAATKFALRGMSQCWQAELRPKNIRVILVNPSYVQTNFGRAEEPAALEPRYLRSADIAHAVVSALAMEARGFIPELTVFATNPWER